jgi:magnesium transporter
MRKPTLAALRIPRLRPRVSPRRHAPGTAPGTVRADPTAPATEIRLMGYGPDELVEVADATLADVRALLDRCETLWVDVAGLGTVELLRELGELFEVHRLALEDVVNVGQRPKVETYDEHLFIVAQTAIAVGDDVQAQQLSMVLGPRTLLTFRERRDPVLEPVRERLRGAQGRIRVGGADYLAYALLDALVDAYFPILEHFGARIESLEEEVLERPEESAAKEIHTLKVELLELRRTVWPHREVVAELLREGVPFVRRETQVFLRDVQDHVAQAIDLLEAFRESSSTLMNSYLSALSNRMNEVMKVLTMIATIFIPLSFIAGLYGMNFQTDHPLNMPELGWPVGYPFALALMALVAGAMIWWFWRKRWFG